VRRKVKVEAMIGVLVRAWNERRRGRSRAGANSERRCEMVSRA
jgi:hypothetical protein